MGKGRNRRDIAVIGLSGRFPGADRVSRFWANLTEGKETISTFSDRELLENGVRPSEFANPDYVKAKGIVDDIDGFDPEFFGYPPKEAERMDPQMRIMHECAWSALEDAGYDPKLFPDPIGVYLGANENHEWVRRVRAATLNSPDGYDSFLLTNRDYFATRISYKLNLKGPSFTLLSACATSLVAIHLACQGLQNGECRMALAGGVSLSLPNKRGYLYQEGLMISSDGHCRTFDARADGTVFGDGGGVVLLKSLDAALAERDHVYAVIRGSAINNDGNHKPGFTAPSVSGQASVIRDAHRRAGVAPESISYVEAHGTGTQLGDPIEIRALTEAFKSKKKNYCRIGSVKPNIGHVNIAAGISSFIKTTLSLERRMIPPTLHFDSPNPEIDFENSPFRINTELLPWRRNGSPRRAGVSAFGFGGTNAHVVLEEAPRTRTEKSRRPCQILPISARTPTALATTADQLAEFLTENPRASLGDVSHTLAAGRRAHSCRRFVLAGESEEAARLLAGDRRFVEAGAGVPVVFMFPGQGSQYVNMGRELYGSEPLFAGEVDRCARILRPLLGLDIRQVLYPAAGEEVEAGEQLRRTEIAQPAVFIFSYALARLWIEWGVRPAAVIGHSIGEAAAACIAGVLTPDQALRMLAERGRMMQQLPPGKMLAVSIDESELRDRLGHGLSIAAANGPGACVVSGAEEQTEPLRLELRAERVASRYLCTSHAFHSEAMEPIAEPFRKLVGGMKLKAPRIPMLSTVTADWIEAGEITDPAYWARNIRQTVRFSAAVGKLLDEDRTFLEVGPGRALSGLVRMHGKRATKKLVLPSMRPANEKGSDAALLFTSVGRLWESGQEIDWPAFFSREKRRRISLPTYPFERRKFWVEPVESGGSGLARLQDLLDIKVEDLADWFYLPSWKRSAPPEPVGVSGKRKDSWLFFMDEHGLGERLARQLEAAGHRVIRLHTGPRFARKRDDVYTVNPARPADYESFCNELRELKRFPRRIAHLWNVTSGKPPRSGLAAAERFQNLGFFSLLQVAQIVGRESITDEILVHVISDELQEVTGDETVRAEKATLLGPVKVIPQEYANVKCCNIDVQIDPGRKAGLSRVAERLLPELRSDIPDLIVAHRSGHRWIQTYEKVRFEKSLAKRSALREKGVYVVTGGLGGIGLVFAEYLARTARARLILTGRGKFPARSRWDRWLSEHGSRDATSRKIRRLRKLERMGARIRVISADVTDAPRMRREIDRAARVMGPVNGVIHAAGLPGEGILQLKGADETRKVFSAKIQGTLVLDRIFKKVDLDFFVLCSSIASTLGGIGLGDYCAANAFLDAFAIQKSAGGKRRVVAINWDMWGQVGMGLTTHMPDELRDWFERELRNGITSREGVEVLRRVLGRPDAPQVVVSTRDLQARVDLWLKRMLVKEKERAMREEDSRPRYARPNLSTDFDAPETETEQGVAEIWGKLFGIEKVGRGDNFYELGGHSLLATTLLAELRRRFEAGISIRDVLDNPTVSELSAVVAAAVSEAGEKPRVSR